jgi:hypothetical protein
MNTKHPVTDRSTCHIDELRFRNRQGSLLCCLTYLIRFGINALSCKLGEASNSEFMLGRGGGSDEGVLPSGDLALYIGIAAAAYDGSTYALASSSATEI